MKWYHLKVEYDKHYMYRYATNSIKQQLNQHRVIACKSTKEEIKQKSKLIQKKAKNKRKVNHGWMRSGPVRAERVYPE